MSNTKSPKRSTRKITKPSLGVALLLSTIFGFFGVDRFYVGGSQTKYGALTLLGTLLMFGIPINSFIIFLTHLSIVFSVLRNDTTAFMYGRSVFEKPTTLDKAIVIIYLIFIFLLLLFTGVSAIILGF